MVMLSFVCWLLASLTFSSSLFLLPIPCSAAAGSCGWCCRKVKLMVMCFLLIFLCQVDVLTPGSSCLVWLLCVFPDFYSLMLPLFLLFLVRSSSVYFFFCLLSLSSLRSLSFGSFSFFSPLSGFLLCSSLLLLPLAVRLAEGVVAAVMRWFSQWLQRWSWRKTVSVSCGRGRKKKKNLQKLGEDAGFLADFGPEFFPPPVFNRDSIYRRCKRAILSILGKIFSP